MFALHPQSSWVQGTGSNEHIRRRPDSVPWRGRRPCEMRWPSHRPCPGDSRRSAGASAPDQGAAGAAHGHESVRLSQMGTGDAWHQRPSREPSSGYRAGDTRGRQVFREPQTVSVHGEESPAAVRPRAGLVFKPTGDARISGQRRQRSWPLRVCPLYRGMKTGSHHHLASVL